MKVGGFDEPQATFPNKNINENRLSIVLLEMSIDDYNYTAILY